MHNRKLTRYPAWRLWPVHALAKLLNVAVKVDGLPFGADRKVRSISAPPLDYRYHPKQFRGPR